ncbi:hypothetical protein EJD97_004927 [Solanum chilense]|uniref:Signal peptidase complex catalytic subunit SEC11 n=1 Tax=Solanum chilense TaxID=4083 RepID=A0A6N2BSF0_SOLCI|nr:hypothetical protein EJD97_004927 [Solanum chilense]
MGWIGEQIDSIKSIQYRQLVTQAISLGTAWFVAFTQGWGKGRTPKGCVVGSLPSLLRTSASMELMQMQAEANVYPLLNDLVSSFGFVHERKDTGEVNVLTKGDNNFGDDRLLYAQGQLWLQRHHIMGRAVGFLPYVGWVTIIMTEKPIIKYILIGALGLLVITSKD